jgi:hypothetical protein
MAEMVKFNSKAANVESASALAELRKYQQGVEPYAAYVRIEVRLSLLGWLDCARISGL